MDLDILIGIMIGFMVGIFVSTITVSNLEETRCEKQIISHGCATYDSNFELKWKENK